MVQLLAAARTGLHWWLRLPLARRRAVLASLLGTTFVIAASAWHTSRLHAVAELENQRNTLLAENAKHSRPGPRQTDFVARLPKSVDITAIHRALYVASQTNNLTLTVFNSKATPASPTQLGTVQLQIELLGSYKALKEGLSDVMTRHDDLRLQQLSIVTQGSGGVKAEVTLVAWLRPSSSTQ